MTNSRSNAMYPEGCPRHYNFALPFHPTHQFVDRTQCTMEGLQQSSRDLIASQEQIDMLVRRLINLNHDEERTQDKLEHLVGKKMKNVRKGVQKVGIPNSKKGKAPKQCKSQLDEIRYQSDRTRVALYRIRQQRRNQMQVNRAIRLGINFRAENEHTNFVLYINEDFPVLQVTQAHQSYAFPPPTEEATRRPRDRRHNIETNSLWDNDETTIFEIKHDLTNKNFTVVHVNTIEDFFLANRDGKSKIIAFPFISDSPQFLIMKNEIGYLYSMFFHTMSGWFEHSKHTPKINAMHLLFIQFHKKLQIETQNVSKEMNAIANIRFRLMKNMNSNLHWYYYPDRVLNEMIDEFKNELSKL